MARTLSLTLAGRLRRTRRASFAYALVAPAVAVMAMLTVYPALVAVQVSLHKLNLLAIRDEVWVGAGNFIALLSDPQFTGAILLTGRWTATIVVAQLALALPIALLLNERFPGRGIARSIVLLPYVIPIAVTAVIWVYVFDANFGVVNELLVRWGVLSGSIAWLSDSTLSFVVLVLGMIWAGTPFMAILLLAALQTFPPELYDAAHVDGANAWQRFRYITFPQLLPTILVLALLRTMWMSHHVDLIFLLTNGGPGIANYTLAVYSYLTTSVLFELGYASAMAIVLAAILLLVAMVYLRRIEKGREYLA